MTWGDSLLAPRPEQNTSDDRTVLAVFRQSPHGVLNVDDVLQRMPDWDPIHIEADAWGIVSRSVERLFRRGLIDREDDGTFRLAL